MQFNDIAFPHAVLGINNSIDGIAFLNPDPEITPDDENYKITVNLSHDNEDLARLVTNEKAEYFCEVNCSATLFRNIYINRTSRIYFEIPKKHVKGRVDFSCVLVANQYLTNYQNSKAHDDYSGFRFDIDAGDILAYFGSFSFEADINYQKLKAVASFMEVVENKDPNAIYTHIDLSKNKIEIQLPSKEYQTFASSSISKELKFASIFHSSIVLNALLTALHSIENYNEKLWTKVIKYRLANEPQFKGASIDDVENIPEIAQKLLGNPFNRLMSGLNTIIESTDDDEN